MGALSRLSLIVVAFFVGYAYPAVNLWARCSDGFRRSGGYYTEMQCRNNLRFGWGLPVGDGGLSSLELSSSGDHPIGQIVPLANACHARGGRLSVMNEVRCNTSCVDSGGVFLGPYGCDHTGLGARRRAECAEEHGVWRYEDGHCTHPDCRGFWSCGRCWRDGEDVDASRCVRVTL